MLLFVLMTFMLTGNDFYSRAPLEDKISVFKVEDFIFFKKCRFYRLLIPTSRENSSKYYHPDSVMLEVNFNIRR